jgi:hypothetical protein
MAQQLPHSPSRSSLLSGSSSHTISAITCVDVHRDSGKAAQASCLDIFTGTEAGTVSVWTLALDIIKLSPGQKPPSSSALLIALDDASSSVSSHPSLATIAQTLTRACVFSVSKL